MGKVVWDSTKKRKVYKPTRSNIKSIGDVTKIFIYPIVILFALVFAVFLIPFYIIKNKNPRV